MFTIEQINAAYAAVKSGSDYPKYVQELIKMGVSSYETLVKDGSTIYQSANNDSITSSTKYRALQIVPNSNKIQFESHLSEHQQGKSDFYTFCKQCAAAGIEKWIVDLKKMTCTYYNRLNEIVLSEAIPSV